MPIKRRQKPKGRLKNTKKKDAQSENMDSQSSQDSENQEETDLKEMSIVLNQLAKKHLLNSSSEASDHAHKENIPVRLADPYDADLETTDAASTAGESDMEFIASHNRGILSPARGVNRQNTRHNKKGKKVSLNSSKVSIEGQEHNSAISMDSSLKQCFPKLYASDTSTPQSGNGSRTELNDSAFGFDSLAAHQELPFSPVPSFTPENLRNVSSSTSGISSQHSSLVSTAAAMPSSTIDRHGQKRKTYNVNLSCLVDSDDGTKRKTKKKKIGKNRVDDWALKIGAEFDDIEMFELSVE